jgi:chitinase
MEVVTIRRWLCAFFVADGSSSTNLPSASLVSLGWNPSPSTNVTGYYLCWGLASGACTNHLNAGSTTTATVGGLDPGTTFYFTVIAYDTRGDLAPPSNEVSFSALANPPAAPTVLYAELRDVGTAVAALQLKFEGTAATMYELQATEDFQYWQTISSTNCPVNGPIAFVVTDLGDRPQQFFRVVR